MQRQYEVELSEDEIRRGEDGGVIHHPLDGPYCLDSDRDLPVYGRLTFDGHDLAKSVLLDDVRVFHLTFHGESADIQHREAWADPLRVEVLQRLSPEDRAWYLSCVGTYLNSSSPAEYTPIVQDLEGLLKDEQAIFAVVHSEFGFGERLHPRLFFEAPNRFLPQIVHRYWPRAIPGWPMEGYNMAPGQIDLLREWDKRPRRDRLFRDVMDQVFIAFYTFPAEHRHFVFVTSKLDLDGMRQLLDIDSLQAQATEIGRHMD